MANRKTCLWCRDVTPCFPWLPIHRYLCPEHKRKRNRMQRAAARAGTYWTFRSLVVRAAGEEDAHGD